MSALTKKQDLLLNTIQLAERWNIDPGTLENWRGRRKGPPYIKLGKSKGAPVLYKMSDIEAFENEMRIEPASGRRK